MPMYEDSTDKFDFGVGVMFPLMAAIIIATIVGMAVKGCSKNNDPPAVKAVEAELRQIRVERKAVAKSTKKKLKLLDPDPTDNHPGTKCMWTDAALSLEGCRVYGRWHDPSPCTAAMHEVCLDEVPMLNELDARETAAAQQLNKVLATNSAVELTRMKALASEDD